MAGLKYKFKDPRFALRLPYTAQVISNDNMTDAIALWVRAAYPWTVPLMVNDCNYTNPAASVNPATTTTTTAPPTTAP